MRKCDNCHFFIGGDVPHCRRFPPTALDAQKVAFPQVRRDWKCGEHKFSLRRLFKRSKPKIEMDQG